MHKTAFAHVSVLGLKLRNAHVQTITENQEVVLART